MAAVAASPPTPSLKEDSGESYGMPVDVEEWINKEFGEMEGAKTTSHEASELITFITAQLVDEYIITAEILLQHEEQVAAAPFTSFFVPMDEGLFYEPDLWSFS